MSTEAKRKYTLKMIIIGDYAVGKTSLVQQFIQKSFKKDYRPTLGADISLFDLQLTKSSGIVDVRLMIWDLAGQFNWKRVRQRYYQGSHGVMIVYDITRAPTFFNIEGKWVEELEQFCYKTGEEKPSIILVGNKLDLADMEKVGKEKGDNLVKKHENILEHLQTSAKTGENVKAAFYRLAERIIP